MSVEFFLSGSSQLMLLSRSTLPPPPGRFATAIRQISSVFSMIDAMR
jgi:hypothetical protein